MRIFFDTARAALPCHSPHARPGIPTSVELFAAPQEHSINAFEFEIGEVASSVMEPWNLVVGLGDWWSVRAGAVGASNGPRGAQSARGSQDAVAGQAQRIQGAPPPPSLPLRFVYTHKCTP